MVEVQFGFCRGYPPDQNNPDGFNGFECAITTHMRWDISPQDIEALLVFMKKEFP